MIRLPPPLHAEGRDEGKSKLSAWRFWSGWLTRLRRLMSTPRFPSTSGRIWRSDKVVGLTERPVLTMCGHTYATQGHGSFSPTRDHGQSGWRPPTP